MRRILETAMRHRLIVGGASIAIGAQLLVDGAGFSTLALAALSAAWIAESTVRGRAAGDDATPSVVDTLALTDAHEMLSAQHEHLEQEIGRLRALLGDSFTQIRGSFEGLSGSIREQDDVIVELIDRMAGTAHGDESGDGGEERLSMSDFARRTDEVLDHFIELSRVTRDYSDVLIDKVSEMAKQMEAVVKMLDGINGIASRTNLLALNASIEGVRAGEAGAAFCVVADEVRSLSTDSRKFSEEIDAVVWECQKTAREIRQLAAEMGAQDLDIAAASKQDVDRMMKQLEETNRYATGKAAQAKDLSNTIRANVNVSMRSLQFEDMCIQVVDSATKNLAFAQTLCADIQAETTSEEPAEVALAERVEQLRATQASLVRVQVSQTSVEEGEVELF